MGHGTGRMDKMNVTWADRRVLVTGASGLFGAALVGELEDAGAEVVAAVRDRVGWSALDASPRVTTAVVDVTDLDGVTRLVNEYECSGVFHLAAQPVVRVAKRDPVSTFDSNVRGTWTVLEACRRAKCVEGIVVVSSDKAYGDRPELPYREADDLEGRDVYEASKVAAEVVCRPYVHTFRLPIAVARCGNLFGAGDLNWNRLVPGTIRSALRGERPVVRSDGTLVRDYFYVRDAAAGLLLLWDAAASGRAAGEAFNFSREEPRTVVDMVDEILRAAGRIDLEPVVLGQANGEIAEQYLSSQKARTELGWHPRWSLQAALGETIRWYRGYLAAEPQRDPVDA
jgi:CDP-glucose 4,6-dehydratase